jgi:hypothetical protein
LSSKMTNQCYEKMVAFDGKQIRVLNQQLTILRLATYYMS